MIRENAEMQNNRAVTDNNKNKYYKEKLCSKQAREGILNNKQWNSRHYIFQVVFISVFLTALLMSMNIFPVAFQLIAVMGSLMAGFIIEIMLSGDKNEQ